MINFSTVTGRVLEKLSSYQLSKDAKAIRRKRLTYLSARKLARLERGLSAVVRKDIPGDIVEFGVALGGTAKLLAKHASPNHRFFGLDVFSMIPEPASDKDDAVSKERYRQIANGGSSGIGGDQYYGYREDLFDFVSSQLSMQGTPVDGRSVHLVKGLFEDTWPTLDVPKVAFAHIDCDWYDPVRFCLDAVAERLSSGGLAVIDDYNDYGGCKTAVDEFLNSTEIFELVPGINPVIRHKQH